ncbi:MAG: hypothetical protein ACRD4I_04270, partial [Candidatus Angelobacter sp.]
MPQAVRLSATGRIVNSKSKRSSPRLENRLLQQSSCIGVFSQYNSHSLAETGTLCRVHKDNPLQAPYTDLHFGRLGGTLFFKTRLLVLLVLGLSLSLTATSKQEIMADQIQGEMEFLASDALHGRGSGTHDELVAAVYLASELREIGIAPAGDNGGYIQQADTERNVRGEKQPWQTRNVIGIIPGRDPKLKDQAVLLTAHLDHLGIS